MQLDSSKVLPYRKRQRFFSLNTQLCVCVISRCYADIRLYVGNSSSADGAGVDGGGFGSGALLAQFTLDLSLDEIENDDGDSDSDGDGGGVN